MAGQDSVGCEGDGGVFGGLGHNGVGLSTGDMWANRE